MLDMSPEDISSIQIILESTLPASYIEYMLSDHTKAECVFTEQKQIMDANFAVREKCWAGPPLDRFFYIFGRDTQGRVLFFDLDLPNGVVMRQLLNPPNSERRSELVCWSFEEWIKIA